MTDHDCIEAIGFTGGKGYKYSQVQIGSRGARYNLAAHVAAYINEWGPVPPGMVVMHVCDNPPCVNPLHLQLGTVADNNRDMVAKGRAMWGGFCKRGHDLMVTGVPANKGTGRRCGICLEEVRRGIS